MGGSEGEMLLLIDNYDSFGLLFAVGADLQVGLDRPKCLSLHFGWREGAST